MTNHVFAIFTNFKTPPPTYIRSQGLWALYCSTECHSSF